MPVERIRECVIRPQYHVGDYLAHRERAGWDSVSRVTQIRVTMRQHKTDLIEYEKGGVGNWYPESAIIARLDVVEGALTDEAKIEQP